MKKYNILGALLIISGIMLNEWTIKYISNYETRYDSIEKSLLNIFIQVLFVSIGIYILVYKKKAIQNILLLTITSFVLIIILELVLSFSCLQNLSSDEPIWIPYKYKEISNNFNRSHQKESHNNKYGFNDTNHSYDKTYGQKQIRIAVLGDSFIWGYGAPDSVIWTRKLGKIFESNGLDCEILNWGKSGWSTLDQYTFLREEGYKYTFDYLIFAFTINDPVLDSSIHKQLFYQGGFLDRNLFQTLSSVFPNTVSFSVDVINNLLSSYLDYGYYKWLVNDVYSDTNLENYSILLKEIREYCQENNIAYSFVMTPENYNPLLENYFNKIVKLFDDNHIPFFNLFDVIEKSLKKYSIRELWANPADGHPGNLVTVVYARHVYIYLVDEFKKMPLLVTTF
jgi:lysophospholipase L1-like esterase